MTLPYADEAGWSGHQDLALQKFLILESQHESLQEQLDLLRSTAHSTAVTSTNTSPSLSPTRGPSAKRHHSRSSRRPSPPTSSRGHALETVIDETTLYEIAAQEQHLYDVNEAIKRSLTELLNSEAVRNNTRYRTWVQSRLMETERELRSGRRRRSH